MANPEHLSILKQGVEVWNKWRRDNDKINPNLRKENLNKRDLSGANLSKTNLRKAILIGANLSNANLRRANLSSAKLSGANLRGANLRGANLDKADFREADLRDADFSKALLVKTNLNNTKLTNSRVYGISAWDLELKEVKQKDLIITEVNQPIITVDNLEVAQFVYLLLNNEKIRDIIGTIGKKGVLIIGRFTEERKAILHAIRDELRDRYNLLPIMFEFDPLSGEPTIKTLSTLAHLSRFVIADLTDAKSVLQELTAILKDLPTLPVKPIIHESDSLPPMGDSFLIMQSMLKPYVYTTKAKLISDLQHEVIDPAEECVKKFEARLAEIRQEWFPWQRK